MAAPKERIIIALQTARGIEPIAKQIMKEWQLTFSEIQANNKEPIFDREIIARVKQNPSINHLFEKSKKYTADNYGIIWGCFTDDQQDIITLKELKLW